MTQQTHSGWTAKEDITSEKCPFIYLFTANTVAGSSLQNKPGWQLTLLLLLFLPFLPPSPCWDAGLGMVRSSPILRLTDGSSYWEKVKWLRMSARVYSSRNGAHACRRHCESRRGSCEAARRVSFPLKVSTEMLKVAVVPETSSRLHAVTGVSSWSFNVCGVLCSRAALPLGLFFGNSLVFVSGRCWVLLLLLLMWRCRWNSGERTRVIFWTRCLTPFVSYNSTSMTIRGKLTHRLPLHTTTNTHSRQLCALEHICSSSSEHTSQQVWSSRRDVKGTCLGAMAE